MSVMSINGVDWVTFAEFYLVSFLMPLPLIVSCFSKSR